MLADMFVFLFQSEVIYLEKTFTEKMENIAEKHKVEIKFECYGLIPAFLKSKDIDPTWQR